MVVVDLPFQFPLLHRCTTPGDKEDASTMSSSIILCWRDRNDLDSQLSGYDLDAQLARYYKCDRSSGYYANDKVVGRIMPFSASNA